MNALRYSAAFGVALACVALAASAEGTAVDPKAPAITQDTQSSATKAKKVPAKAAPKKAPARKPAPAKAAKKVDSRPMATGQGGTVQKYEAGKAPELRDSKGNVIPTAPDDYDV